MDTESMIYDTLKFMTLIEKTILAQTQDQYPFATVCEQELSFYSFHQQNIINDQWYEMFNIKVDIRSSIGFIRQLKVLLRYVYH